MLGALTVALLFTSSIAVPSAHAADGPVGLGVAGSFSVLAGSMVTNTGTTVVSGDIGVSPGTTISGFPPGVFTGTLHSGDPVAAQAQTDLSLAYNDADAREPSAEFSGDNNGRTYTPGIYHSAAAFALTGTMTLDAQDDPDAVFIFQIDAALNTAANSTINLINGANPSQIFWQVSGAAGTGASSSFTGTLLANGSITIGADASFQGHALSRDAVTLAGNTLTAVAGAPKITINGGPTTATNNTTPTISGTTDAPGSTLTLTIDSQNHTTETQPDGTWAITTNLLSEGPYALTASTTNTAGHTGTTTQTLTIEQGMLSITVPAGPVDLGSSAVAAPGAVITGHLGQVTVVDTRSPSTGRSWEVSVIATDFTPLVGGSIPASDVT